MRARVILWFGLAVLIGGCQGTRNSVIPVPDAGGRVTVETSDPNWPQRFRDLAVCLVRTGLGAECQSSATPVRVCDKRTVAEVTAWLQPILDSLPQVRMAPFAMNAQLGRLFPGAEPTSDVLDARRNAACRDWGDGRACAAIRYGDIAVLFLADDTSGPVTRIEAFRVTPGCRDDIPSD